MITEIKKKVLSTVNGILYDEIVDPNWYRKKYKDLEELNDRELIEHYIKYGSNEFRKPNIGFDPYYIANIVDMDTKITQEEVKKYLSENYSLANNIYELWHYYLKNRKINQSEYFPWNFRYKEGYPFPFSEEFYLQHNIDVLSSGMNAFEHFINWGINEDRKPIENYDELKALVHGTFFIKNNRIPSNIECWKQIVRNSQNKLPLTMKEIKLNKTPISTKIESHALFFGIVVYKNSKEELYRCIDSIKSECKRYNIKYQIHLKINCTTTYEFTDPEVRIHQNEGNIGFGKGHNRLMDLAFREDKSLYFCVNPDGYFMYDSIGKALSLYYSNKPCVVELNQLPLEHPKFYDPNTLETAWFSGACFLMDKTAYERTKGFDESFHMYCEDVDLSWRIRESNLKIFYCHDSYFYHDTINRAFEANDDRKKLIFKGALTLASKYNSLEKAKIYSQISGSPIPDKIDGTSTDNKYACFDFDLRFSPSRFL